MLTALVLEQPFEFDIINDPLYVPVITELAIFIVAKFPPLPKKLAAVED